MAKVCLFRALVCFTNKPAPNPFTAIPIIAQVQFSQLLTSTLQLVFQDIPITFYIWNLQNSAEVWTAVVIKAVYVRVTEHKAVNVRVIEHKAVYVRVTKHKAVYVRVTEHIYIQ